MKKSYIYAGAQILAQREHTNAADPTVYDEYFYVHDRLGSIRLVVDFVDTDDPADGIDDTVVAVNSYTYTPYGQFYESAETVANPWTFTGQWYDEEINQYYLRARQYDPAMMRFTSRDPVRGGFPEPMTLHKYLYCLNDPVDRRDWTGKFSLGEVLSSSAISASLNAAMTAARGASVDEIISSFFKGAAVGAFTGSFGQIGFMAKLAENHIRTAGAINGMATGAFGELYDMAISGNFENLFAEMGASMLIGAVTGGLIGPTMEDLSMSGYRGLTPEHQEFLESVIGTAVLGPAIDNVQYITVEAMRLFGYEDEAEVFD